MADIIYNGDGCPITEGTVVTTQSDPTMRWIVHNGWYTYLGSQARGWYMVEIGNGFVKPITAEVLEKLIVVSSGDPFCPCPPCPPGPPCPPFPPIPPIPPTPPVPFVGSQLLAIKSELPTEHKSRIVIEYPDIYPSYPVSIGDALVGTNGYIGKIVELNKQADEIIAIAVVGTGFQLFPSGELAYKDNASGNYTPEGDVVMYSIDEDAEQVTPSTVEVLSDGEELIINVVPRRLAFEGTEATITVE